MLAAKWLILSLQAFLILHASVVSVLAQDLFQLTVPMDVSSRQLRWEEESVTDSETETVRGQVKETTVKDYEVLVSPNSEFWGSHSPRALMNRDFSTSVLNNRKKFFLSLYGIVTGCFVVLVVFLLMLPKLYRCCSDDNTDSDSDRPNVHRMLNPYSYGIEIRALILDSAFLTPLLLSMIFVYLGFIAVSPYLGIYMEMASCQSGFLWEVHTIFFFWLIVTRLIEVALFVYLRNSRQPCSLDDADSDKYYGEKVGHAISLPKALMKLGGGALAALDVYTDINFVVIAYQCNVYLWKFSLIIFFVGVVLLQVGQGVRHLCRNWNDSTYVDKNQDLYARNMRCALVLKFLHMDLLYEAWHLTVPLGITPSGENANLSSYMCARCCCEDLAQGIVQTIYVVQFHKNYMVFFSIACGLLSSFHTACVAFCNCLNERL